MSKDPVIFCEACGQFARSIVFPVPSGLLPCACGGVWFLAEVVRVESPTDEPVALIRIPVGTRP